MIKQAVCKTVAFGRCRFKSYSADLYAAVPQLVEELSGRQTAGEYRLAGSSLVCGAVISHQCAET